MKASELGNQHGFQCPDCEAGDELTITATMTIQARLLSDGCDEDGGDIEWDDDSPARCRCGWNGVVKDLITVEIDD